MAGRASYEKHYLNDFCHIDKIDRIDFYVSCNKLQSIFNADMTNEDSLKLAMDQFVEFTDNNFSELIRQGYAFMDNGRLYYSIPNPADLNLTPNALYNFFEKFRILLDARFNIYVNMGAESVASKDLSEGQRQIIKILGMLGVCKSEDCLVLMDEPDAHMNPKWKYDLKTTIDQSLVDAIDTQALIATHDPLVINGVEKEFIRIFTYNRNVFDERQIYVTEVIEPQEDTAGMGIDGLLQSEYYGLPTVLDKNTKKKVDDKRDLLVKKKEGTITDVEKEKLNDLTEEIADMTFTRNMPTDDLYDEYVVAMHKIYKTRPEVRLTADQIAERNAKAEEILRELLEK